MLNEPTIDLRAIRKGLGLSQKQLGDLLGIDQSTVSDWETRGAPKRGPGRKLIQSFAMFGAAVFKGDRAA
jgi:DNA-binding transcriptional regulator YiaG